jgi:hypothetical protein
MNASTGLIGIFLALGALAMSSVHSKTAEAHVGAQPAFVSVSAAASVALTTVAPNIPAAPEPVLASELSFAALAPTPEPPRTLRRMETRELTPAMMQAAAQVVRQNYAKPVGTNVDIHVAGKHFVARIERHYHPEGGPIKPWGFHPGVSLFAIR